MPAASRRPGSTLGALLAACGVLLTACADEGDAAPAAVQAPPPPEDRGLLPMLGYQQPLVKPGEESASTHKVVFFMPRTAVAALDAARPAPPGRCYVTPEVGTAADGSAVVNLRLMWQPNQAPDDGLCAYNPVQAQETHMLFRDIPATATLITDASIVDADRGEVRPAAPGNRVPLMPDQRQPGG